MDIAFRTNPLSPGKRGGLKASGLHVDRYFNSLCSSFLRMQESRIKCGMQEILDTRSRGYDRVAHVYSVHISPMLTSPEGARFPIFLRGYGDRGERI
jgi:hypothetical protein